MAQVARFQVKVSKYLSVEMDSENSPVRSGMSWRWAKGDRLSTEIGGRVMGR